MPQTNKSAWLVLCFLFSLTLQQAVNAQLDAEDPMEALRRRIEGLQRLESNSTEKRLSPREEVLLEKIRRSADQRPAEKLSGDWRRYGVCIYKWSGWRLVGEERITSHICMEESSPSEIKVSCKDLQVALESPLSLDVLVWWGKRRSQEKPASTWRWSKPDGPGGLKEGQDEMVAALCANIKR